MHKITDGFLRGLRHPATGRIEIRDSVCPGLVLRVTSTGAATWSTRGLLPSGKHGRLSLGKWPHVGISEARKRAKQAIAATQAGVDPVAEKRAARAAAQVRATLPTVATAIERWRAAKAPHWRPTQAQSAEGVMRLGVPATLAEKKLAETGRRDWVAAIDAARSRGPAAVASFYRYASAFLSWAEASGLISNHPLPRRGAAQLAPASKPRERTLSDAELTAVWHASKGLHEKPRAFIRLLILSGARRTEVAGMTIGEVDRRISTWTIPPTRAKNATARSIALGPYALAEIETILPRGEVSPKHRLLGRTAHAALSGFSGIKSRLDALAPLDAWSWHDLRRTCRTGMARLGIDDAAAETAIGHISNRSKLVRTYDRHDRAEEARQALLTWQSHVAALVAPESRAADVVRLDPRRRRVG